MTDFASLTVLAPPGRRDNSSQVANHAADHDDVVAFANALLTGGQALESIVGSSPSTGLQGSVAVLQALLAGSPYPGLAQKFAGTYVSPPASGSPWFPLDSISQMRAKNEGSAETSVAPLTVVVLGDSIVGGTGSSDPFIYRLARMMTREFALPTTTPPPPTTNEPYFWDSGPSLGFRSVWNNNTTTGIMPTSAGEWAAANANEWYRCALQGQGVAPAAADVAPFGEVYTNTAGSATQHGLIYTLPSGWVCNSFEIVYVDAAAGAMGMGMPASTDFSFVIGSGSLQAASSYGATNTGANKLRVAQVPYGLSSPSFLLSIRPGPVAGGAGTCYIVAVIIHAELSGWAQPGIKFHNLGRYGSDLVNQLSAFSLDTYPFYRPASTGDPFQIFDLLQPDLVLCQWINGQNGFTLNSSLWSAAQSALAARLMPSVSPYTEATNTGGNALGYTSDLVWMNYYDATNASTPHAQQQAYRDATKANMAALGVPVLDVYDAWTYRGMALSNLSVEGLHPNVAGHNDIAAMYWRFLRLIS